MNEINNNKHVDTSWFFLGFVNEIIKFGGLFFVCSLNFLSKKKKKTNSFVLFVYKFC